MYKITNIETGVTLKGIVRISDGTYIPIANDNSDYQQFKLDLANGVQLMDADGNPMTADQIQTFLQGLA